MTTLTIPQTARALAAALRPYGPVARSGELELALDPPVELDGVLRVLQTGVRVVLSGRPWWATVEGPKTGRFTRVQVVILDPGERIPAGTILLAAGGDPEWDRIDPEARLDLPDLFET